MNARSNELSATHQISFSRFDPDCCDSDEHVAVEEPLELRVNGAAISVLMRTPGDDEDLIYGFLATEQIISSKGDVIRISDLNEFGENRIVAFLEEGVSCDLSKLTRHVFTASSCGLCGKATIESVLQVHGEIESDIKNLQRKHVLQSVSIMRERQLAFSKTGGLHAAALFDLSGNLLVIREDVGRHNAVDKVIGYGLRNEIDFANSFLLVSGRVSFEILQKSLAVAIPCIAAISAPSSLAVDFAVKSNQTLIGFLRPPAWNLYHEGAVEIIQKP